MSRGRPAKCGHIAVTSGPGSTRTGHDATTADLAKPQVRRCVTNCPGPARMLDFRLEASHSAHPADLSAAEVRLRRLAGEDFTAKSNSPTARRSRPRRGGPRPR
jgi:hypothetical protein